MHVHALLACIESARTGLQSHGYAFQLCSFSDCLLTFSYGFKPIAGSICEYTVNHAKNSHLFGQLMTIQTIADAIQIKDIISFQLSSLHVFK